MGPSLVKPPVGRGDMFEATDWMFDQLIEEDSLSAFKVKWDKLDEDDQAEINAIFDGEDASQFVNDEFAISDFKNNYEHKDRKKMVNEFTGWLEAHPMEITEEELEVAKARFM